MVFERRSEVVRHTKRWFVEYKILCTRFYSQCIFTEFHYMLVLYSQHNLDPNECL